MPHFRPLSCIRINTSKSNQQCAFESLQRWHLGELRIDDLAIVAAVRDGAPADVLEFGRVVAALVELDVEGFTGAEADEVVEAVAVYIEPADVWR